MSQKIEIVTAETIPKEKPRGWRGSSGYYGPSWDVPNILAVGIVTTHIVSASQPAYREIYRVFS